MRWVVSLSVIAFGFAPLYAQTVIPPAGSSGVAEKYLAKPPASLERPPEKNAPHITVEDSRKLEDAGAGPTFFVKKIEIRGNAVFNAKTLAPFVDVGEGMNASLGVLALMAQEIVAYYAEHGYILAQAYIPQQEVKDGVVKIVVSEGKIDKIEVTGNKKVKSKDLVDRMRSVRQDRALQEKTLERTLMDMNDLMGVTVRSVLRPGQLPGTSDLILDVTETPPYSVGFDADNFGSRFTGRNRFGFTGVAGNQLTLGDQFSLRIVRSDLDQASYQPSYLIPLNDIGTTAKLSFAYSEQTLGGELAALSAGGNSKSYNGELAHRIYRDQTSQIKVKWGIESRNSDNNVLSTLANHSEILDTYIGLGGTYGDAFMGQNFFNFKVQRDIQDFNGIPALMSRVEGRDNILIGQADIVRYQGTGFMNTYFIIKANGQLTSDRALLLDIFAVGGYGTVRGFPLAARSGDRGFASTVEYVVPFPWQLPTGLPNLTLDKIFSVSGFIDHGEVFVTRAQPGETRQSITGVGGGLGVNIPKQGKYIPAVSFALGYAYAHQGQNETDRIGNASGSGPTPYLNGSLNYPF